MPRLIWDDQGSLLYQNGVDRGMLYVDSVFAGWTGLVSVNESPDGGDPQSFYVDGRKVLDVPSRENFAATIECLSVPAEFAPCAGRLLISPALYAGDQPRRPFGFSYRTLTGNDTQGEALGYRVHLVYNATAKNGDLAHQSVTGTTSPESHSIDVSTVPLIVPGYRPASHFTFDTRLLDVTALEAIIYGDSLNDPRMPTASELVSLLGA